MAAARRLLRRRPAARRPASPVGLRALPGLIVILRYDPTPMIISIEIEGLRGIGSGRLEGLAPLTVLTGPNASGKSTVLDALLIAASPDPSDAAGRAVKRHPAVSGGARWLCRFDERAARIAVTTDAQETWERRLKWFDHCDEEMQRALLEQGSPPPYSMVHVEENQLADGAASAWTAFGADNRYETQASGGGGLSTVPFVRLVDPGLPIPLHKTFTEVTRAGRRDAVHELLAELIPGFERLEIIALTEEVFGLGITRCGRSVPLGLSGDGIQAFAQLALEVAAVPNGLVLIEEPEVYQHPRAIRQGARVLLANARRGVQMILSTHSLELIDGLLGEATEKDLAGMALFNLRLDDGALKAGRRSGEEIAFARQTLENDLR